MYQPNHLIDTSPLALYLSNELQKISDHTQTNEVESVQFKVWNTTPGKPRQGQVYYADGANWNPGSGEGLYLYLSGGTWQKL